METEFLSPLMFRSPTRIDQLSAQIVPSHSMTMWSTGELHNLGQNHSSRMGISIARTLKTVVYTTRSAIATAPRYSVSDMKNISSVNLLWLFWRLDTLSHLQRTLYTQALLFWFVCKDGWSRSIFRHQECACRQRCTRRVNTVSNRRYDSSIFSEPVVPVVNVTFALEFHSEFPKSERINKDVLVLDNLQTHQA